MGWRLRAHRTIKIARKANKSGRCTPKYLGFSANTIRFIVAGCLRFPVRGVKYLAGECERCDGKIRMKG